MPSFIAAEQQRVTDASSEEEPEDETQKGEDTCPLGALASLAVAAKISADTKQAVQVSPPRLRSESIDDEVESVNIKPTHEEKKQDQPAEIISKKSENLVPPPSPYYHHGPYYPHPAHYHYWGYHPYPPPHTLPFVSSPTAHRAPTSNASVVSPPVPPSVATRLVSDIQDESSLPLHKRRASMGKWSEEEDEILKQAVKEFGGKNWKRIAARLLGRTDVQCLHRWQKVLRPGLVKGPWTTEEDATVVRLVKKYGCKKWSLIARHLNGRLGKQCRERWYNHLVSLIGRNYSVVHPLYRIIFSSCLLPLSSSGSKHQQGRMDGRRGQRPSECPRRARKQVGQDCQATGRAHGQCHQESLEFYPEALAYGFWIWQQGPAISVKSIDDPSDCHGPKAK
jgi:hypothetical protein